MTANALQILEDNELIKVGPLNDNFDYLNNKISTSATNLNAYVQSQIASAQSNIENEIEAAQTELQGNIDTLSGVLTSSGLYVTTYINGTSWYREYFSDSAKTTRVWLEQGGLIYIGSENGTVSANFLRNYTNNPCSYAACLYGDRGSTSSAARVSGISKTSITVQTYSLSGNNVTWVVRGR